MKTAQIGLVFDFNAFAALEEKCGINILDKASLEKLALTPSVIRQLVWAGLLHKKPAITIEEAGARVTMDNLTSIAEEIQRALTKSLTGK